MGWEWVACEQRLEGEAGWPCELERESPDQQSGQGPQAGEPGASAEHGGPERRTRGQRPREAGSSRPQWGRWFCWEGGGEPWPVWSRRVPRSDELTRGPPRFDYRHTLNACVLPGRSVACQPFRTPHPTGVPADTGRVPCVLTPARPEQTLRRPLGPSWPFGAPELALCVFPAFCLPVPGRPCPSGLERRSRKDQRWKSRQTAAPCPSSGFLSLGQPGPHADGHGIPLIPLCFPCSLLV